MTVRLKSPVVVSYGGGLNSTALLVDRVLAGEPLDLVLFADTGGEKPPTYAYTIGFDLWLKKHGGPGITVVRYVDKRGGVVTLEADCLRKGTLPSLAYGMKGCSLKWKRDPQHKYLNHWGPAVAAWARGDKVLRLIGYDADEAHRALGKGYRHNPDKFSYQYPLIERRWGREECRQRILDAGLPLPPKSSCFFCPASKEPEIRRLRALDLERTAAPNFVNIRGLGRRWAWRDLDTMDCNQLVLFPEMACECYDG